MFSRREKAGACAPTGNPRRRIRAENALGVESRHHHSHDDSESTVRVSGKCGSEEESKLGDVSFLEFPALTLKKRSSGIRFEIDICVSVRMWVFLFN